MTRVKLIIAGILALLALIVIFQNTAPMETRVLFITLTMPRAALLIGTALVGFIVGVLVAKRLGKQSSRHTSPSA